MEQDNIEMNEKQSDKKDKKILLIVILLLVVVTAGAACWYLSTREDTSGKTITLVTTGSEKNVEISGLKLTSLSGTVVNGKGEKKDIKGQGIKLADVIGVTDYSEVTVTADDAYAASVKKEEIDQAWLKIDGEEARLIVFGDENSKRDVKNVVRIEVK